MVLEDAANQVLQNGVCTISVRTSSGWYGQHRGCKWEEAVPGFKLCIIIIINKNNNNIIIIIIIVVVVVVVVVIYCLQIDESLQIG